MITGMRRTFRMAVKPAGAGRGRGPRPLRPRGPIPSGEPEKIRILLAVIKTDFEEAADRHVLNCSSDGGCVAADPWPRRGHQDHDAKANAAQVMLVTKTLVSRDQDFVAIEYRDCEQLAVFELVPSFSKTVSTSCSARDLRSGAGVPWSNRIFMQRLEVRGSRLRIQARLRPVPG